MKSNIPKITDGELNVLQVLWEKSPLPAGEIVFILKERIGWNRNTTYTFINRLVEKKVIKREEPGYICTPLFSKDEISISETQTFLEKMYGGSLKMLLTSFINNEAVSEKEIKELKKLIEKDPHEK
ncbi:MAG: BlaI/MecI/CopY family transcriptional regulator [Bacillota bacterium]|nr:BlaI/MecI/CopY family transcriptional regulator [Bacillota bacterium]